MNDILYVVILYALAIIDIFFSFYFLINLYKKV